MTQPTAPTMTATDYLTAVAERTDALARRRLAEGRDRSSLLAQAQAARFAAEVARLDGAITAISALSEAVDETAADLEAAREANNGTAAAMLARYQGYSRVKHELAARFATGTMASAALQVLADPRVTAEDAEVAATFTLPAEADLTPRQARQQAVAGGQATSAPLVPFEPVVHVALQHAGGFEDLVSVHFDRRDAVRVLAARAREVLADHLGYVPLALQGEPDLTSVVEALQGNGLGGSVQEATLQW